ncbi:hypothetical protein [Deinococcus maricopensis]|uniref:Uncharacterized protein n=1 Tax=Deinococcus maricopensis (strain DSM 21211 / LMG 22137 / NRRL B-23946 / LB-34) TaxID=709986 RepID=E8U954_DEIML|nr:hypothetical protein [Deinococcus maricopensis]ADV67593.1 hypothetical protein Deima_1948 [Deinococcus maricopensis DSM 21211]
MARVQGTRAPVLLVMGPVGYGKSVLLQDLASVSAAVFAVASRDEPVAETLHRALAKVGVVAESLEAALATVRAPTLVLVPQAHVLDRAQQESLLALALAGPPGVRWVLEVRHAHLPGVQSGLLSGRLDILGPDALRFTPEEAAALQPDLNPGEREDLARHEGWPTVVAHYHLPYVHPEALFEELVGALPPTARRLIAHLRRPDDWSQVRASNPDVLALLDAGLPLLERRGVLRPTVAFQSWLQGAGDAAPTSFEETYVGVQVLLQSGHVDEGVRVADAFVAAHEVPAGQQEHFLTLLQGVGQAALTPRLRDVLAYAAVMCGRVEWGWTLATWQEQQGLATFTTYNTLLVASERRNDQFSNYLRYSERCEQHARTPGEHFRVLIQRAYAWILQLDGVQALQASLDAMRFTESDPARITTALEHRVQAHLLLQDAAGVEAAYREAVAVADAWGDRRLLRGVNILMAEYLKDVGRYDDAARVLDDALFDGAAERPDGAEYHQLVRGYVASDLGRYVEATSHFERSVALFEDRQHYVGIIMPLTFLVYVLWRLGDVERLRGYAERLRTVVRLYWNDVPAGSTEAASVYPLAEGLLAYVEGDVDRALACVEGIRTARAEYYDSVLLAALLTCQWRYERGELTPTHVSRLLQFSAARPLGSDATLRAHAGRHHRALLAFCIERGWGAARLEACLSARGGRARSAVTLLTAPPTWSGTEEARTVLRPVEALLLAYCVDRAARGEGAATVDEVRRDVWGGQRSRATVASQLSRVRRRLRADRHAVAVLSGTSAVGDVALDVTEAGAASQLPAILAFLGALRHWDQYAEFGGGWVLETQRRLVQRAKRAVQGLPDLGVGVRADLWLRLWRVAPEDEEVQAALSALLLHPALSPLARVFAAERGWDADLVDVALHVLRTQVDLGTASADT